VREGIELNGEQLVAACGCEDTAGIVGFPSLKRAWPFGEVCESVSNGWLAPSTDGEQESALRSIANNAGLSRQQPPVLALSAGVLAGTRRCVPPGLARWMVCLRWRCFSAMAIVRAPGWSTLGRCASSTDDDAAAADDADDRGPQYVITRRVSVCPWGIRPHLGPGVCLLLSLPTRRSPSGQVSRRRRCPSRRAPTQSLSRG
jgi:hypothetical protein